MVIVCSSIYEIYIYRVNQTQMGKVETEKRSNERGTRPGVKI